MVQPWKINSPEKTKQKRKSLKGSSKLEDYCLARMYVKHYQSTGRAYITTHPNHSLVLEECWPCSIPSHLEELCCYHKYAIEHLTMVSRKPKTGRCCEKAKHLCCVCCKAVEGGKDEALLCEGQCQKWLHRYCAGVTGNSPSFSIPE